MNGSASHLADWAQTVAGFALIALLLLDVFLTVLYARIGYGMVSRLIARATWAIFCVVSQRFGRARGRVLSFCGPAILVFLLGGWALGLSVGSALVIHPRLGKSLVALQGATDTSFTTALVEGNAALSIVSSTNVRPVTAAMRLYFVFNAIAGASVISLTLTYLMQVYSALHQRNALAVKIHVASAETGDAAELLSRLGARGKMDGMPRMLDQIADEMVQVKESHHLYPVLFYFRFPNIIYAVERFTFIALDACALLQSSLHERHAWLKESSSVDGLARATHMLMRTLKEGFLRQAENSAPYDDAARQHWMRRHEAAVKRLTAAGIDLEPNLAAAARAYADLRSSWEPEIESLTNFMEHTLADVEVGTPQEQGGKRS